LTDLLSAAIYRWFDDLDDLVEPSFFSVASTWAGAARGTEMEGLKANNLDGQRALVLLHGIVTILTNYLKTRQMKGFGKLIARGSPPAVGRLLIYLNLMVYPAAEILGRVIFKKEEADNYRHYLFVRRGRIMKTSDFTAVLQEFTRGPLHVAMGMRSFRQAQKFLLNHLADINLEDLEGELCDDDENNHANANEDARHITFGHSASTGLGHYAIEEDSIPHLADSDITKTLSYGLRFQRRIGVSPPLLVGPEVRTCP
jgi:hypothetical protein